MRSARGAWRSREGSRSEGHDRIARRCLGRRVHARIVAQMLKAVRTAPRQRHSIDLIDVHPISRSNTGRPEQSSRAKQMSADCTGHVVPGARRARGTSLCPGHILLFGLVNILFSSLLSKSLTIKGREARPGRERGRAGMPRSTTRSQASAAAGAASSMEAAMPVLPATAEPADLSQPPAAVASCVTFGEQDVLRARKHEGCVRPAAEPLDEPEGTLCDHAHCEPR